MGPGSLYPQALLPSQVCRGPPWSRCESSMMTAGWEQVALPGDDPESPMYRGHAFCLGQVKSARLVAACPVKGGCGGRKAVCALEPCSVQASR